MVDTKRTLTLNQAQVSFVLAQYITFKKKKLISLRILTFKQAQVSFVPASF